MISAGLLVGLGALGNSLAGVASAMISASTIKGKRNMKRLGGYAVRGYRDRSKWSGADLREIRARNGVGRPPYGKSKRWAE